MNAETLDLTVVGLEHSTIDLSDVSEVKKPKTYDEYHEPERIVSNRRTQITKSTKNLFKVVLLLGIILTTVMTSIGYLEPSHANNTIKALSDLRTVLVGTLQWQNVTTPN